MFEKVKNILAKQLRIDSSTIKMESRIKEDLNADSLSLMELLMNLEDEYGIIIAEESLSEMNTVSDVVKFMEKTIS